MDDRSTCLYDDSNTMQAHDVLWPAVYRQLRSRLEKAEQGTRVLDVGCGRGNTAAALAALGFDVVVGIDVSAASVEAATAHHPIANSSLQRL